jgi:uncharacterized protein YdcH (DUF465 family)
MLRDNHDLFHEFPEHKDRISELRADDARFASLCERYHQVNHEVTQIAHGRRAADDLETDQLKRTRVRLKDEIYSILTG